MRQIAPRQRSGRRHRAAFACSGMIDIPSCWYIGTPPKGWSTRAIWASYTRNVMNILEFGLAAEDCPDRLVRVYPLPALHCCIS